MELFINPSVCPPLFSAGLTQNKSFQSLRPSSLRRPNQLGSQEGGRDRIPSIFCVVIFNRTQQMDILYTDLNAGYFSNFFVQVGAFYCNI